MTNEEKYLQHLQRDNILNNLTIQEIKNTIKRYEKMLNSHILKNRILK